MRFRNGNCRIFQKMIFQKLEKIEKNKTLELEQNPFSTRSQKKHSSSPWRGFFGQPTGASPLARVHKGDLCTPPRGQPGGQRAAQPAARRPGRGGGRQAAAPASRSTGGQTLGGSFSAVSKPNFTIKYAFESPRQDLHNALLCTAPESHFLPSFC